MRALVTGGGRGIGAGIAWALAADGWDVVVGARSRTQVEAVADEIGGEWIEVDVSDRDSVERSLAAVGELDLLVANAGISEGHEPRPSWEIDPDKWWHVYEVNVLGVHRGRLPRRRAMDAARACARARPQARNRPLRRARRPLPPCRARQRRRAARPDR